MTKRKSIPLDQELLAQRFMLQANGLKEIQTGLSCFVEVISRCPINPHGPPTEPLDIPRLLTDRWNANTYVKRAMKRIEETGKRIEQLAHDLQHSTPLPPLVPLPADISTLTKPKEATPK